MIHLLAQNSLPAIEVWFYVLSIATIVLGLTAGAWKTATAWGRARGTWDEQLELTKKIVDEQVQHRKEDDRRFAAHDRRIRALEGVNHQ